MIRVTVIGDKELALKFQKINAAVQTEVLEQIVEKAADRVVELAKARAPARQRGGYLKSTIGIKGRSPGRRDIGTAAFYGRFIELGTGPRTQKRTGRYTGQVTAQPFLRPALEDEGVQEEARTEFKSEMRKLGAW